MLNWRIAVVILPFLSIFSCREKYPSISKAKMAMIMADLGIADYTIREYPPEQQDSVKEILVKELLRIHQLDRKELDTNLYLYQMDSRAYQDVLELMIPRIVQLKNQVDLPGNTE